MSKSIVTRVLCLSVVAGLWGSSMALADWVKDPPGRTLPDVEKEGYDLTCWLATAANMLAAAEYPSGTNYQTNAEAIYDDLIAEFGRYQ